ncbi:cytochrome C biogenesis protein CycH [Rhizobium sp. Leaf384]|uniref:c-type cytochrome biogenesis protein CcmI n=1 Tax=unclassified Rhizobium TaxID=2613769 RepID=UPI00071470E6|nr:MULTISPECIES: c-type cytochrome biogenesis protein CcmI [unclassified Rhizobium]KQS77473.1 cytochrome C biogenesis protein CycH [Rhizobium sp. Leaf383]KQS80621.1 cytochrome C biogenesis protein CycH [Rhizobium sp. Leaf384]
MLFWIIVAVMTATVAALLLVPLLRAGRREAVAGAHDAEVYRDQLEELKRDARNGLIAPEEAALARAEIARRLLAASAKAERPTTGDRSDTHAGRATGENTAPAGRANRLAQAAVIVVLPLVGLCLYLKTGSPELPDAPLAARLANPGEDIELLIAQAERQLAAHPDDGAGYDVLAPIYYRSGRFDDAVSAYSNAIRLKGPSPQRLGGYAESLLAQSGGLVAAEARKALEQSLALEPRDPRARFYLALGLEQDGKEDEALAAFRTIVAASPADAPWLPLVNQHIASLAPSGPAPAADAKLGGPDAAAIARAQTMSTDDRRQMIEGMVSSLAAKLKDAPDNLEGWQRIIRSYAVLGEKTKAEGALQDGLAAFPRDGAGGRQLLALAAELGIDTGKTP